ncbi:MAG: pyrimidine reductase family protein [Acidimicrobiia bacterium]
MRQLWPEGPAEVGDVDEQIAAERRVAPGDRPWLAVNTVTSLDGATAVRGVSAPLQAPADKAVFGALRAIADVILVGAGTVRAEGYGPARPTARRRADRRARGQAEVPPIAVVTGSLELDLDAPLFTEAEARTVVLTSERSDRARRRDAAAVADVVVCGTDRVDPHLALAALHGRGLAGVVLCEGGPRLNGDLIAADLVDEWCLSVSPLLAAGDSQRAALGIDAPPSRGFRLDRLWLDDEMLLARYVR